MFLRVFFILCLLVFSRPSHADDKSLHFTACYAISNTVTHLDPAKRWWSGPVVALGVGLAKEFTDKAFDPADLAADAAGISLSIIVIELD